MDLSDGAAVERFRRYLRMKSVYPDPTAGYREAMVLFKECATAAGLQFKEVELVLGHPMAVLTWAGSRPDLPSVILNSHMDVVPVDTDKWTKAPFDASIVDGKIYARGAQDMKSVGSQYIEAVMRLKATGFVPVRTIHLLYVPDEEVGGLRGIKMLLGDPLIKALNPGLVLDEGLASPDDKFTVFYGERKIWWLRVTATGAAGHGSRFVEGTAVEKLMRVINSVLAFREDQKKQLEANCGCGKQLGDYTTMNCTQLLAGDHTRFQYNVIPTTAVAGFDCRIPCSVDLAAFKQQVSDWCAAAGEGVTWELVNGTDDRALDHAVSPPEGYYWDLFAKAVAASGIELHPPSVFPAATDSRWIRMTLGTPCFGFSPMRRTPILLHDHDEFVSVDTFLEGIGVYEKMVPVLANDVPS